MKVSDSNRGDNRKLKIWEELMMMLKQLRKDGLKRRLPSGRIRSKTVNTEGPGLLTGEVDQR